MERYKLWLDDKRIPPNAEWIWVRNVESLRAIMQALGWVAVSEIALDNDLGRGRGGITLQDNEESFENDYKFTEGYKALDWIESVLSVAPFLPMPNVRILTDNSTARQRMIATLDAIQRNFSKSFNVL